MSAHVDSIRKLKARMVSVEFRMDVHAKTLKRLDESVDKIKEDRYPEDEDEEDDDDSGSDLLGEDEFAADSQRHTLMLLEKLAEPSETWTEEEEQAKRAWLLEAFRTRPWNKKLTKRLQKRVKSVERAESPGFPEKC